MRWRILIGSVAFGLLMPVPKGFACVACWCVGPATATAALEAADAVFVGLAGVAIEDPTPIQLPDSVRPEDIAALLERVETPFRVTRVWKGDVADTISIFSGSGGGDCSYSFDNGEEYLVFARRAKSGRLVTGICTRTARRSEAADDLRELGPGSRPR